MLLILAEFIKKSILNEWNKQGHHNTGGVEADLDFNIKTSGLNIEIEFTGSKVMNIIDYGISKERIPFSNKGRSKESAYIKGLIDYFKSKGNTEKESIKIAFRTAKVHKREGLPTNRSIKFSKTGIRKDYVNAIEPLIVQRAETIIAKLIESEL